MERTVHTMQCADFEQEVVVLKRPDGLYWSFQEEELDNDDMEFWAGPHGTVEEIRNEVAIFGEEGVKV